MSHLFFLILFNITSAHNNEESNRTGCKEGDNMETHYASSPLKIVKNSAVPTSGLIIQSKDLRPDGSFVSSALGNPSTMSVAVKQEATGQGTCTHLSVQNIFCKLLYFSKKE